MSIPNTIGGKELLSYVERFENIQAEIDSLKEGQGLVMAEAKSRGFNTSGIKYVVKQRKKKPHDRQEEESIRDLYMNAAGMGNDVPLFRQLGALARDAAASGAVVDALKKLVPDSGDFIARVGGKSVRIFRDKDGEPQVEDWSPPKEPRAAGKATDLPPRPQGEIPECTPDEAEVLGAQSFKDNVPIIKNPFPFGDVRRARFDEGWRNAAGHDGMGD